MFQLHLPTPNLLIWSICKEHLPSLCRKPPLKLHLGSVWWSTSTLLLWYMIHWTLNQNYLENLFDAGTSTFSQKMWLDGSCTSWFTWFLACLSTFQDNRSTRARSHKNNVLMCFFDIFTSTLQVLSKGQHFIGILEDLQKQLRASVTTEASNLPPRSFRVCMTWDKGFRCPERSFGNHYWFALGALPCSSYGFDTRVCNILWFWSSLTTDSNSYIYICIHTLVGPHPTLK